MNFWAWSSLAIGLAALIKSTLDRRRAGALPILDLIRERFAGPRRPVVTGSLAVLAGSVQVLGPLLFFTVAGWMQGEWRGIPLLLGLATVVLKLLWAAMEELIFRGAVIPELARFTPGPVALGIAAILFAFGHLDRMGNRAPDLMSLAVLALDGVGFGLAYLASRSLWAPTLWHAAKNICIWLVYGESTLQFVSGIARVQLVGPSLWVGAPGQAGLADLIFTLLLVLALLFWRRGRWAEDLAWLRNQRGEKDLSHVAPS